MPQGMTVEYVKKWRPIYYLQQHNYSSQCHKNRTFPDIRLSHSIIYAPTKPRDRSDRPWKFLFYFLFCPL